MIIFTNISRNNASISDQKYQGFHRNQVYFCMSMELPLEYVITGKMFAAATGHKVQQLKSYITDFNWISLDFFNNFRDL